MSHMPRASHRSHQHPVGLLIVNKPLYVRIPLQVSSQPHRDIAQVPNRDRAMSSFDWSDRLFARDYAVDKIAGVIVASIQVNFIRSDDGIEQRLRTCIVTSAVRPYPAFRAFESHAAAKFIGDGELDAVLVDALEIEAPGRIIQSVPCEIAFGVYNLDRPGILRAHSPLGYVGMMASPIGDLPAGVVKYPAEVHEASGGAVGSVRRLTQPHIIVKTVRHEFGLVLITMF